MSSRHKDLSEDRHGPAPNAYNANDHSGTKTAPAFSIKGRHNDNLYVVVNSRSIFIARIPAPLAPSTLPHPAASPCDTSSSSNIGPGPGALDVTRSLDYSSAVKGTPSFSMSGRAKDLASSNAPGPGAYNSEDAARYKKAPAFSMSGRAKEDAARLGPGPGAYTTPDALSKLSASIKGRPKSSLSTDSPGPAYNVDYGKTVKKSPAFSMTGRARDQRNDQAPGPGTYAVAANPNHKKPPAFSMSGRNKELMDASGPGPGAYNTPDALSKRGASIKGRHEKKSNNHSPGPAYSVDISKTTKGAPSFSMGGRTKDLASSNAPGPGAYNSEDAARYKKAPAFSMSGRAKEDAARLGPGPGAYTTPDALSKLSASIKGRPKSSLSTDSPGPATTWTMARRGRNKELMDASGPGPGAYNTPDALSKRGASIKGRHEEKSNNHSPGPAYSVDISKTTKGAPSFSMGGRTKDLASSNAPGPGQYSVRDASSGAISFGVRYPDKVKGTPSFSMSGRAKDLASSNAPGPGAYNSEDAARYKKAPAFSMSGRAKEDAARLGPGPGAYTTPDALSKLSASIKGRPKSSLSTDSPGPAYNVDYGKTVKKSPAFSMTGRARDQRNDQAPGPGTYAVAANPNHKKPPAFSMSGRNKELMDASGPGPGAYNTPDALSKRGASIKGRHEEKSNNHSPGPAYSVDISKTTKGAPSFSMGGRTKDLASSNAPGPGQYSVRDASSGAISFGVRYPDKVGILPE
ncbi:uncharacterized protein MONBRDRAFT_38778 [Monosiga brevicollis MX1]|uniref:Uncharacterized protein n=1 Tax=Monosiga brevicollis TaxID=81824 RepID=A9VA24_MONBE|nr:uncharacterized protein MONBRDRAFT_38778 [Monosiga brevicollis MX1]EDQ85654.1 predicted protein [Monosiga brevicollis MX1]|eukprot:XP_001749603.1 hypothetical protein [Monosiga brevicollis MX1]